MVCGVPCGLRTGRDRAVARLQDISSKTRPIPVDIFIIHPRAHRWRAAPHLPRQGGWQFRRKVPPPLDRVVHVRRKVWWAFTVDTWERSSTRAESLSRVLHELLSIAIALDEARNSWELRVWIDVLTERQKQRQAKGTLKWWTGVSKEVTDFLDSFSYQAPALPDLRAELRGDIDAALDDPNSLTKQLRAEIAD